MNITIKKAPKIIFISLIILLSTSFTINAQAATLPYSNNCFKFNRTTGAYEESGNGGTDCVKTLDGEYAYCIEWKKHIRTHQYEINNSWYQNSKEAILTGILIKNINNKYTGNKAYATIAATLNTLNSNYLNNASSYNYYSKNYIIKEFYDDAFTEYDTYKNTTSLPNITTSLSNRTFSYNSTNKFYISNKVTISNLLTTYGGDNDKVTYTITPNKGAQICSRASGIESSCKDSVTISGVSKYSFYVKVSNINTNEVVQVKISGSNSSVYPSSIQYYGGSSSQKLVTYTDTTIQRSSNAYLQITVPDLVNHTLTAIKVNELGEELPGAILEIYQDDPTSGEKLASGTGTSTVTYTSQSVLPTEDKFFDHDYYLVEKMAPDSYVLNSQINHFYIKGTYNKTQNKTICYYNGGEESTDSEIADNERCNFENYQNKCKKTTKIDGKVQEESIVDLTENHDCIFESEDTKEDNTPAGTEEKETEQTTSESNEIVEDGTTTPGETTNPDGTTDKEEKPEPKPVITYEYEKVCYKLNTEEIVKDTTFCDNKNNYMKVEESQGNIVVTQANNLNKVTISKKDATGKEEIKGAYLKICTKSAYESKKAECEAATTIENVTMEWRSQKEPKVFNGLKQGEYYIVETLAPKGYEKVADATLFRINLEGKVIVNKQILDDGEPIVINNKLTSFTVSKQDMATSKELSGATLSICLTYLDENNKIQIDEDKNTGDCIQATLADGTTATWVSKDKPHTVEGLEAGTYYLVESIAPKDYSTAESILFTLNEDGSITDKDGNSISDKKIIMKDELLYNPKTAELPIGLLVIIGTVGLVAGVICYNQMKTKENYNYN